MCPFEDLDLGYAYYGMPPDYYDIVHYEGSSHAGKILYEPKTLELWLGTNIQFLINLSQYYLGRGKPFLDFTTQTC